MRIFTLAPLVFKCNENVHVEHLVYVVLSQVRSTVPPVVESWVWAFLRRTWGASIYTECRAAGAQFYSDGYC